ncbi:MAG: hypothetical protein QG661_3286, partial [Actinomycetota bacterium]|nr:hypothetical protein [Actinomycetota bacterium]
GGGDGADGEVTGLGDVGGATVAVWDSEGMEVETPDPEPEAPGPQAEVKIRAVATSVVSLTMLDDTMPPPDWCPRHWRRTTGCPESESVHRA